MRSPTVDCPAEWLSRRSQHGAVLIIALIALVAMTLAGIALVRSVDTSTLIAGNLTFKQSATSSGDGGVESSLVWLSARVNDAVNAAKDPWLDATYELNTTIAASGYYPTLAAPADLFANTTWVNDGSVLAGTDPAGNTVRYVIQRMCRAGTTTLSEANCLFSDIDPSNSSKADKSATRACASCPAGGGGPPLYRVTVRVSGPRNTVSYVQSIIY